MGRERAEAHLLRALGARVRQTRHERGWTLETLGEHSGLHYSYIASVERGERNISLIALARLAAGLDVDLGTLMAGLRLESAR